ncbi:hypothetical protein [Pluralibacter gergoviae]|uniref:hypothetical protein n=1 Tax=Pluralibacter gergoviae TaxID=61647 RepID=UPI0012D3EA7D|nr:hypothetical protein [Pluralibacter gergoviae]
MEPWDELYSPENDFYFDQIIDDQYDAWKASRDEEIELPAACADDEYFIDGVFQPMRYERDVERAVIAAGFKVKGG